MQLGPYACDRTAAQIDSLPASADLASRGLELLDAQLAHAVHGGYRPLVLFSGGVDSALIASRVKRLQVPGALYVHFSFGDAHEETVAAREIARRLEIDLEIVVPSGSGLKCLEDTSAWYPTPFADQSTVVTHELCDALPSLVPPGQTVVLDGTGADGAFGLAPKTRQLERALRIPGWGRTALGQLYGNAGWRLRGPVEYRLRALRRVGELHPASAVVAQNSLFHTLYRVPDLRSIDDSLQQSVT
jgi:asparagine synthetase B (glutamine-hydrolysing)